MTSVITADFTRNAQKQENIVQVQNEVERVCGANISESNARRIIATIQSEGSVNNPTAWTNVSLLVNKMPLSAELAYINKEYRLYMPSANPGGSVELTRKEK